MFNHEKPFDFKKMHDISAVDGFVEITENLADMIKFVANEPSVGLFYVQQHTHTTTPNLVNLKNNIIEKSHETSLHTEDIEDSITMLRSMKECGIPVADEMIKDIKKSLTIISSKQPKRGLIYSSSSGFLGRTNSWAPTSWSRSTVSSQQDSERSTGYLSSVFNLSKQRANSFNPAQVDLDSIEASESKNEKVPFDSSPAFASTSDSHVTVEEEGEREHLLLSEEVGRELQEESQLSTSLSHQQFLSLYENFDEFKAAREAQLEEWLRETGNQDGIVGKKVGKGGLDDEGLIP